MQEFFLTPKMNTGDLGKIIKEMKITSDLSLQEKLELINVTLGGETALQYIKDLHNEIILKRLHSKAGAASNQASAFGKHYSVNIRPNIV